VTTRDIGVAKTRPAPWTPSARWNVRAWLTDLDGSVHWIEFVGDGDSQQAPLVFVHGLGGSHLNWVLVGPALAAGRRVVAIDLPGFGLSPGVARDCSVEENALVLRQFLHRVIGRPVVLVGNSMGGMVSLLAAAAEPEAVHGIVLVDPALPIPVQRPDLRVAAGFMLLMTPLAAEVGLRAFARRQPAALSVERVIRACFADPTRMRADVLDAAIELTEHRRSDPSAERSFVRAARSLVRMLARPAAYRAVMDSITRPTLLIHGEADRLVPASAARVTAAAHPAWGTAFLSNVGHTPQLESPHEVIDVIEGWLGGLT
jgi:pimeloyl-ACP methyl ester carboxylesterase